jgi:hypothetical protein
MYNHVVTPILFRFRAMNQPLLFLLNDACFVEEQQIPIYSVGCQTAKMMTITHDTKKS